MTISDQTPIECSDFESYYNYSGSEFINNQDEITYSNIQKMTKTTTTAPRNDQYVVSNNKISSYKSKHVSSWNKNDFLRWMLHEFADTSIAAEIDQEVFEELSDEAIFNLVISLDENKFIQLEPNYGKRMCDELKELRRNFELTVQQTTLNSRRESINESNMSDSISSNSADEAMNDLPFLPINRQTSQTKLREFDEIRHQITRVSNGKVSKSNSNKRTIKPKDCIHIWQFCRDLLKDSTYNPSVIEWVDPTESVFKINNKEEMAKMWSFKKNRKTTDTMTYENMSRGMRHSRVASDYFRVPEKRYKRKFHYQFGDKALENCEYLRSLRGGNNV